MGMLATIINSLSLKAVFENAGQAAIVMNSFNVENCGEKLDPAEAIRLLETQTIVIFGGGTGRTHLSTDTAAAMRAKDIQAEAILMGKNNTDGVFDKDPNKYKDAKFFDTLTYEDIINKKLEVVDAKAMEILKDSNIETLVFDLNKKNSISNALQDKIKTTTITV
jgi:uridylate kinase